VVVVAWAVVSMADALAAAARVAVARAEATAGPTVEAKGAVATWEAARSVVVMVEEK
jgi:hypothetical protein